MSLQIAKNRTQSIKLDDPANHFVHWHFEIAKHHYETLGVTYRQFVKNKTPYFAWAITQPPNYNFSTGYIFYSNKGMGELLQVAGDWDAFRIEVHHRHPDTGYTSHALTEGDLCYWLEFGTRPPTAMHLDFTQSKAGLMAWRLRAEADTKPVSL